MGNQIVNANMVQLGAHRPVGPGAKLANMPVLTSDQDSRHLPVASRSAPAAGAIGPARSEAAASETVVTTATAPD